MTSLVKVVIIVVGGSRGLADIVGGVGVGNNYTSFELLFLGK